MVQFSLRALLILFLLGPAFFFGGIHFERERFRRGVEAINAEIARQVEMQKAQAATPMPNNTPPTE
jgi:hypothetical protein